MARFGSHRSFPLQGSSRSRRMLAIRQSYEHLDLETIIPVPIVPRTSPSPRRTASGPQPMTIPAVESTRSVELAEPVTLPHPSHQDAVDRNRILHESAKDRLDRIKSLIASDTPATWVFTGDSLLETEALSRESFAVSDRFAEKVRWGNRRLSDVVIDTCLPHSTMRNLATHLNDRVLRFAPDVVFLMCGMNDATFGEEGIPDFVDALDAVVAGLLQAGSIPLINAPYRPVPIRGFDISQRIQVYVDATLKVAQEHEVPVVDHWRDWEVVLAQGHPIHRWMADDGLHPNADGLRRISRHLLYRLGVSEQEQAQAVAESHPQPTSLM